MRPLYLFPADTGIPDGSHSDPAADLWHQRNLVFHYRCGTADTVRYCDIYCAEEKYVSLFLTLFLCYTELLSTYWNIGKIIVEHEQGNNDRADYGKQTLKQLSKELTKETIRSSFK